MTPTLTQFFVRASIWPYVPATGGTGVPSPPEQATGVAAALLLPLTDLVPAMAARCQMHPSTDRIGAELAIWSREMGLETPARAASSGWLAGPSPSRARTRRSCSPSG
ncbi:hypothetical protein ACFQX6_24925 [Streptosporangium lutulentum]